MNKQGKHEIHFIFKSIEKKNEVLEKIRTLSNENGTLRAKTLEMAINALVEKEQPVGVVT